MGRKRDLGDKSARHDTFYRRAKSEGFAARAVYKLEELDRRFGLVHPGNRVLDLGCWPGSWLQYLERRVGPNGRVVGIDRKPVEIALGPNVRVELGDLREVLPELLLGDLAAFDVVVSDMAPDTTGIRDVDQARSEALFQRALEIALAVLRPGGRFAGKLFQGGDAPRLRASVKAAFGTLRECKPAGSRTQSIERYLVGLDRR